MKKLQAGLTLTVALLVAAGAKAEVPVVDLVNVIGRVTASASPVENALVLALDLTSFSVVQTSSRRDGTFALPPLRAAAYRIFAVKQGFAPAIATVLPIKARQSLRLDLKSDGESARKAREEIWSIRAALPADVLRELDFELGEPAAVAPAPRFEANMISMTAMSEDAADSVHAQTSLGLRGDLGGGWQLGFEGNVSTFDEVTPGGPMGEGESQGVTMELRSSPGSAYRLASTRNYWRPEEISNERSGENAGLEAHRFEFQSAKSQVEVQYRTQENVFGHGSASERIEFAGRHSLLERGRSTLGISVRFAQESPITDQGQPEAPFRYANVSANGQVVASRPVTLRYALDSRITPETSEWTPGAAAEFHLGSNVSLVVSGAYKVQGEPAAMTPESIVVWNRQYDLVPRYTYSFGLSQGNPSESSAMSVTASIRGVDTDARLYLDDEFVDLWDTFELHAGDEWQDVSLTVRRQIGGQVVIDLTTSAGAADNSEDPESARRSYVVGTLQSYFRPTGTSLDVSYRHMDSTAFAFDGTTERVKVRMGQSLYLPIDVRLLVGLELARTLDAPASTAVPSETQRRYLGGIALAF